MADRKTDPNWEKYQETKEEIRKQEVQIETNRQIDRARTRPGESTPS